MERKASGISSRSLRYFGVSQPSKARFRQVRFWCRGVSSKALKAGREGIEMEYLFLQWDRSMFPVSCCNRDDCSARVDGSRSVPLRLAPTKFPVRDEMEKENGSAGWLERNSGSLVHLRYWVPQKSH